MLSSEKDITAVLKAILDTAVDGIITISQSGIIERINNSAATLFEYDAEELIGKNISNLMPNYHARHHDTYIHNYLKTQKPKIIGIGREVEGLKKSGIVFPFKLSVSQVILNNRIIFAGIIHDLTDIKQSQEKLIKLNEQLEDRVMERTQQIENIVNKLLDTNTQLAEEIEERKSIENKLRNQEEELKKLLETERELSDLKSRFISIASHEFRTPLTTILSSAALLSRYELTDQQAIRLKHINKIKSAVTNLTGILNDFLSLSKLEEGAVTAQFEEVDICSICYEIIEELEGVLKQGQFISFEIIGPVRLINTDPKIIKNTLFNLVSNASKYSNEGKEVKIRISFQENQIILSVIDQGIGIPESEQKYLFGRFFRASNVINIQGTGLGLTIVKKYVDMLNGEIQYSSTEHQGSIFTITLKN